MTHAKPLSRKKTAPPLLFLVSLVIGLSLTELAVRLLVRAFPFEEASFSPPYLTEKDKNLRWRFSPGPGVNQLGLRNREVGAKGPFELRLLFLGDSLLWMSETSSGKLHTEAIADKLNASDVRLGKSIQIINAGIPGYTTYQEVEFFKMYGLDMQPDALVLNFVLNDLHYKYLHRPSVKKFLALDPDTHLHRFDTQHYPGKLAANSQLAHMAVRVGAWLKKRLLNETIFPFDNRGDVYLAWKDYGWDETKSLLSELKKLTEGKGIPLLLLAMPIAEQLDDTYRKADLEYVMYPQARIAGICNELGVPYLDLSRGLYTRGGTALFRDYLHLNAKGNDVVAELVARYLQENASLWRTRI